jgi:hypothetical protein
MPPECFFNLGIVLFGYWIELWQIKNRQKKEPEKLAFYRTKFPHFQM